MAGVDSHAATRSYHLIPTKSPRVPANDGVAAGWNTNTPSARPNNRVWGEWEGEEKKKMALAFALTCCLSCCAETDDS